MGVTRRNWNCVRRRNDQEIVEEVDTEEEDQEENPINPKNILTIKKKDTKA